MNSYLFVVPVADCGSHFRSKELLNFNETFKTSPKRCYGIPEVFQLVPVKNDRWQKI